MYTIFWNITSHQQWINSFQQFYNKATLILYINMFPEDNRDSLYRLNQYQSMGSQQNNTHKTAQMKTNGEKSEHQSQKNIFQSNHKSSEEFMFDINNRNSRESGAFFNNFAGQESMSESGFNFLKRLSRDNSKHQSTVYEQNDKKYKQVLRDFYNNTYYLYIGKKKTDELIFHGAKKINKQVSHNYSKNFQAIRLVFNKQKKTKGTLSKISYQQYLVKKENCKNKQITIYEMKNFNYKSVKPIKINGEFLNNFNSYSSFEYDLQNKRLYCYDNVTLQIVGIGLKKMNILCRIKIKFRRRQPLLYYHRTQQKQYLMVIGGFSSKGQGVIEGSNHIEIYEIKKWQIVLKPLIIKTSIGRISPIVFSCDHEGESCVYIIGGKSNAIFNPKVSQLIFLKDQDDLNETTNQTGIRFKSTVIDQWFQNEEQNIFVVNNLNIRFENSLKLYNGCVLLRKLKNHEKLQLFLPDQTPIYNIKLIKNDVHIIESQLKLKKPISQKQQIRLTIGYHKFIQEQQSPFCQFHKNGGLEELKVQSNLIKNKACSTM